nr:class 10 plant pathogenesis-related protein 2E-like [Arachis hypogaea]
MKSPPPCPTAKLYNAMKDADSITPKIIDDIKSVEIVEGNGGPGTIKKLTIVEDGESKFILHKVEAIDEANYAYNYSVVGRRTQRRIHWEAECEVPLQRRFEA